MWRALLSPWTLRAGLLVGAFIAAVVLHGRGYDAGFADAEAEAAKARQALEDRFDARTAQLRATTKDLARARAALAQRNERIEDAATADPDAGRLSLSSDSVRRLQDRWGAGD